MGNRKAAEAFLFQFIKDIDPSGYNTEMYTKILGEMSDTAFHEYMVGIRSGEKYIAIFKPPYEAKGITVENNLKIAPKYGLNFFERLIYSGDKNTPAHMTPIEYLVVNMPYRRQSQTLDKKTSIPDDNNTIDEMTYQPTGASKGAKISYPELQVLIGMGLDKSVTELVKYRGGDRGGFNAYNGMMLRYGSANIKTLENFSTGVESTKAVKAYLLASHLRTTL